jgi:hypothetical protein
MPSANCTTSMTKAAKLARRRPLIRLAVGRVGTHTPLASAAPASTRAIQYSYASGVPDYAATAVVTFGAYSWTATGGYSIVASSPNVSAL